MKTKKGSESFEILNKDELNKLRGGSERHYVVLIIDGKYVKIYI